MDKAVITGSLGSVEARIGDRFVDTWRGTSWEIVAFKPGEWNYSPATLGGCMSVICRHLGGELDGVFRKYTVDGLCDWCADSVASELIRAKVSEGEGLSSGYRASPPVEHKLNMDQGAGE